MFSYYLLYCFFLTYLPTHSSLVSTLSLAMLLWAIQLVKSINSAGVCHRLYTMIGAIRLNIGPRLVVPLISTLGINNKVTFLEKGGTG